MYQSLLIVYGSNQKCLFLFSHKKGLISACGGLGGALSGFFGESMINPNNIQLKEGESYYDYTIAQNTINYYFFQGIVVILGTGGGCSLIYKYTINDTEINISNIGKSLIRDSNASSNDYVASKYNDQKNIESSIVNPLIDIDQSNYKKDLKKVFKSRRLWLLFGINFCSGFLSFLILTTFKVIGTTRMFSISALKIGAVGAALGSSICSPLWGLLYDYFGFKYLISIINISGIALGVSICFSMNNEVMYVCLVIFNTIILSGIMPLFHPHIMKVFGIKYVMELGGLMGFVPGISNVLASVYAFIVSLYLFNREEVFYISYLVGSLFHLISFCLACCEKGLPFEYNEGTEEVINEKKEEEVYDNDNEKSNKLFIANSN